jgi:VanZ family protein
MLGAAVRHHGGAGGREAVLSLAMAPLRHRSSATWLAGIYAVLVVYASLYPFEGWRWPPGQPLSALALLPSALYQSPFDIWTNLLGYLPLGALMSLAGLRSGWRVAPALALSLLLCAVLSYCCEALQHFVPGRVPAREDLAFNVLGGLGGCALALSLQAAGFVDSWSRLRTRWIAGDAAFALALLVLWPVGLLFPAPVPLGLGQLGSRLRDWGAALLADVPWAEPVYTMLAVQPPPARPLSALAETLTVALGLLAPCMVAYSVVKPGWRRGAMALGALGLALGTTTLSTALNFGPQHALSWLGPHSVPGLVLGTALALLAALLARRVVAGVGLVVLSGLVAAVAQAPDNPFYALSLQAWEQGRFVRFHGLAQWIGWLWPYAAIGWLLSRLAERPTSLR